MSTLTRTAAMSRLNLLGAVTAQGNHERTITASRDVSVTASSCEMYHGYKLRKLLWQNAEFFFTKILEMIDTDFDFQDGQRRMMAVVTRKIIADISISSEASNQRDSGAGVGGPEGTVTLRGNYRVSDAAANNKEIFGGIAGIHFLMFPIERLDEHTFRIRPGVTVDAERREDSANHSSTRNAYEKWYKNGASEDMDANRTQTFNMPKDATRNSTCPPRPALVLTAEPQRENGTPSSRSENILREQIDGGVISAEDLVDGDSVLLRPHLNRIPYVDINLKPALNEFATRQVSLALKFQSETEQDRTIYTSLQSRDRCTALRLFRSALRKRCYGSTIYALECLGDFYSCSSEAASNEPAARAFKFCAVVLRNPRESYGVWLQILMGKARLRYENRPEAVIAEIVATPSPWSRMQFFLRKVPIKAMFHLGLLLEEGAEGVKRDPVRAVELYERAIAERGDIEAMFHLGKLLRKGADGVERDAVRAIELYGRAIEKGDHVDAVYKPRPSLGTPRSLSLPFTRVPACAIPHAPYKWVTQGTPFNPSPFLPVLPTTLPSLRSSMTKQSTSRPQQPRRRAFPGFRNRRPGEVQSSPLPAQSPLPKPCKTIHEELDCLLSAFSLFRPMIPDQFKLFGVLYVNPDPDCRHEPPEVTTANLKQICEDYREEHAANGATPEIIRVVDELLGDMERNVEAEPVAFQVSQASATEDSVRVALDARLLGVVTAQGNRERTSTAARDVSLTVSSCEKYHGFKLRKLLWQNAEFFFTKILEMIDTDFDFQDGQRRMMAIVTKKIIADISISNEASNQRDTGAGVGGPEGTVTLQADYRVSDAEADEKQIFSGIAGIHFLMFPIERLDEHTFRIRPGVTVDAERREDSANNSSTRNAYEKWYKNGASEDMDANRTQTFNMPKDATRNSTCPPRPALVLTAEPQREDDTPSRSEDILREQIDGGVISAEDLVDGDSVLLRPHLNRIPYVDINLKPALNEFATRQVSLALKFQSETEQDRTIYTSLQSRDRCTALRLFRSALRKRCYGSTIYALECLGDFYIPGHGCNSFFEKCLSKRCFISVFCWKKVPRE
ncbi:Sel1-repeat containing protein [Chondrus crispus]|uniref:Sel1-repeat containing protein n=1 Tax=Chondrus crispus TaxID=2769 RepID=R7QTB1_CHOCR|nr:Sel1-repeat containing protein [Chondrus crispus]CDF40948.1 Sel1-repeat containing protein [Chondrus crispus]|eukprot:XP_005711242.1 Sel1-repeat containing protein [Chondrus crispus]